MVSLRNAELSDAPVLAELWSEVLRRADHHDQVHELELIIKSAGDSAEERVVVADFDGGLAGAVYLRATTVSPLNLDPVVQVLSPYVFPHCRRHGVGRALMDSAVTFAEEIGVGHVMTAATHSSRDGNRFMARLGFGPHAMMRLAPTHLVRAKLTAQRPELATGSGRHLTRVLAARRSMRRAQATGR